MAITMKSKPGGTPHADAAADIVTEAKTVTKDNEIVSQEHEQHGTALNLPDPYETISVGMAFRMPIADYTMVEYRVDRSVPFNPVTEDADAVYESTKDWVEARINALVEDQQAAME